MTQLGAPLIENDLPKAARAQHGRITISIHAFVAGKSINDPATAAESIAVWAGRDITIESSSNGAIWTPVQVLQDITDDTLYSGNGVLGNLYYRAVPGGLGGNLVNLRAYLIEGDNATPVSEYA